MDKPAATSQPISDLLCNRWSPRAFNPARELSDTELSTLAEAARWAPSCFGAEPWGFVICPRQDTQAWDKAIPCLMEANQAWAKDTSVLIFAAGQQNFEHNGKPNVHHLYDTGAASMSLVLQADNMGLRAHQMGGFDPAAAKEAFGLPEGWDFISVIAVGEQIPAEKIEDESARERESAPRQRKPIGERFFRGQWGTGLA